MQVTHGRLHQQVSENSGLMLRVHMIRDVAPWGLLQTAYCSPFFVDLLSCSDHVVQTEKFRGFCLSRSIVVLQWLSSPFPFVPPQSATGFQDSETKELQPMVLFVSTEIFEGSAFAFIRDLEEHISYISGNLMIFAIA